jgi:hypothetical protein
MDTTNLSTGNTAGLPVPPNKPARKQNLWNMPLGSLINLVLNNRETMGRFLSLTGGSVLYCLSALSIVYGITQIVGPPLAKSGALGDILPCVAVLNAYELALLAVLVLIVVWRNVTDDAISLVILVALFLVASGMTLGVVAPSGLDICLAIGFASVILGLAKLYVLRRYVSLQVGALSVLGLALILAWTFLGPSLMARPLMARTATDELRRHQWLLGWLVLLAGAALTFVDAAGKEPSRADNSGRRIPFLHTHSMVAAFLLVLLAATGVDQYGIAYMFAVDYVFGDFIPLLAIMSLLTLEFIRSLRRRAEPVEVLIACTPLVLTILAVPNKLTTASTQLGVEMLFYPPVVLGLTGTALLWIGFRHGWVWSRYVAIAYVLGVLLTLGRGHGLNWQLGGGGAVIVLLILGAVRRNVSLCFAAVVALAVGLGTTDVLARFARSHNLTAAGATVGVAGLGIIAVALAFGRRTPAAYVLIGTISAVLCIFDYLPKSLQWADLGVLAMIGVLFGALLARTNDIAPALVLWVPVFPRVYLFATRMSSWSFVALSFLLLFLGAIVSLFLKRKLQPEKPLSTESPEQSCNSPSESGRC